MSSALERMFLFNLRVIDVALLDGMEEEFRFHEKRKWRFDFCWPELKIAVEVDGGQYKPNGGRHNSDADREKINTAISMGWRVLRFSGKQVTYDPDECINLIKKTMRVNDAI